MTTRRTSGSARALWHVTLLLAAVGASVSGCGFQPTEECPSGGCERDGGTGGGGGSTGAGGGTSSQDAGPVDGGRPDGGTADGGGADAGASDAGAGSDAGASDAGASDAGNPDAGTRDAGERDAGNPDAGNPDAGALDAGSADGGIDAGVIACFPSTSVLGPVEGVPVAMGCLAVCGPNEDCIDTDAGHRCRCRFPTPGGGACAGRCLMALTDGGRCAQGTWLGATTFAVTQLKAENVMLACAPDGGATVGWEEKGSNGFGSTLTLGHLNGLTLSTIPSPVGTLGTFFSSWQASLRYAPDGRLFATYPWGSTPGIDTRASSWNGSAWTHYPQVSAKPGPTHASWPVVAFAPDGTLWMVHNESFVGGFGGGDNWFFLHAWTDGGWVTQPEPAGTGTFGFPKTRPDFAFVEGKPLVVFNDFGRTGAWLFQDGGWADAGCAMCDAGYDLMASMADNGTVAPVVSLLRNGQPIVFRWNGADWDSLGAVPCEGVEGGALGTAAALDPGGAPTVAWWVSDGGVRAQRYVQGGWLEVPIFGGAPPADVNELRLTFTPNGLLVGWIANGNTSIGFGRLSQ